MAGMPRGGSHIAPSLTASPKPMPLGAHLVHHLRVDLLEVHVADPLRVVLDELEVVAVAVGDVPGVQAQGDQVGVGLGQEALDPLVGVHVAVGVRVELDLQPVLVPDRLGQPVDLAGVGGPLLLR